jgi:lysylphosphatidylglycerol synthetase-like protein (DUF2156 family)
MREALSQFGDMLIWLRHQVGPPWTLDKVAIDAGAVLAAVVVYAAVRIHWSAQLRAVPVRVATTWAKQKWKLVFGIGMTAGGIVLGWFVWRDYFQVHELAWYWQIALTAGAFFLVLYGIAWFVPAIVAMLISPFDQSLPPPGLEAVQQQRAYGDARAAVPHEVDAALRGAGSRARREFED